LNINLSAALIDPQPLEVCTEETGSSGRSRMQIGWTEDAGNARRSEVKKHKLAILLGRVESGTKIGTKAVRDR
jgi:hypothetical protein